MLGWWTISKQRYLAVLRACCQLVALGLRDSILADLVEQGFVADLQQAPPPACGSSWFGRALVRMASASASSLALRARDFSPPLAFSRTVGRSRLVSTVAVVAGLQFLDGQLLVAQHQVALDEVIQLAQVARPGIVLAGLQHIRRERQRRPRVLLRHARHEMLQQDRNFFLALAQRRQLAA